MTTLKLRANEKGYYGDDIVREGQLFDWTMPQWAIDKEIPVEKAIPCWASRAGNERIEVAVEKEPDITEEQREAKIIAAVQSLDHSDDDHWTEGGEPMLSALKDICGFRVSRAEVKALCPSVEREG